MDDGEEALFPAARKEGDEEFERGIDGEFGDDEGEADDEHYGADQGEEDEGGGHYVMIPRLKRVGRGCKCARR